MRIITRSKIYRAFPELDEFGDERCELLMKRLRSEFTYPAAMGAAAFFAAVVMFVATFITILVMFDAFDQLCVGMLGRMFGEPASVALSIALVAGAPSLAALLARDVVLWRFLHRVLAGRIELIRCRGCRYLLLGQRVVRGFITCPECGRLTTLMELGLNSPTDLIPPETDEDALPDELSDSEPAPPPPPVADIKRLIKTRDQVRSSLDEDYEEPDVSEPGG